MTNLDDTYGPFPGRPTHPDMEILSEIVVNMDRAAEEPGFDFLTHVHKIISLDCLVHLAAQRIMRAGVNPSPITISIYLDAFMAGVEFSKRNSTP